MNKKQLVSIIDNLLKPIGFARVGNVWKLANGEIIKCIDLQKSNFENRFYINCGYIIPDIELTTKYHIGRRIVSNISEEQKTIETALDIDSDVSLDQRNQIMKKVVQEHILNEFLFANTKQDIRVMLCSRSQLNNIPLVVKKFFSLES